MSARFDAAPADLQAAIGNAIRRQRKAIGKWIRPMAAGMARGDAAAFERLAKADFPRGVRAAIVDEVRRYAADAFAFGRAQAERERRKAGRGTAPEAAPADPVTLADPTDSPPDEVDAATAAEAGIFGDRITDELLRTARLAATRAAANQVRLVPGAIPLVDEITAAVDNAIEELATSSAAVKEAAIAVSVRAVSGGRREVFDEDEDQIASVEYSAVMDPNTCGACGDVDGKKAESLAAADDELPGTPNIDCEGTASRCRCIWIVDYK
jgi:hypothetical protein